MTQGIEAKETTQLHEATEATDLFYLPTYLPSVLVSLSPLGFISYTRAATKTWKAPRQNHEVVMGAVFSGCGRVEVNRREGFSSGVDVST